MSSLMWKTTPQAKIYQYLWSPAFLTVHLFNLINMIMSFAFPNQAKISTAFLSQVFFREIKIVCAKEWGTGSFPLLHTIGTVHLQITR